MTQRLNAPKVAGQSNLRDASVDTLRGIAIILMVAGHVIGTTANTGMTVAEDSNWRYFYLLFEDLRMPLFTALSGFVYAARPLSEPSQYQRFVVSKVRRLVVPLVTVGTMFVVLQSLIPGTNRSSGVGEFWKVYVYGTGHFWFLQSVFLIFLLVGLLDALRLLRSSGRLLMALGAAILLAVLVRVPDDWDLFSINGAIRLLPFFLLGYGLRTHWHSSGVFRWATLTCTAGLFFANAATVTGAWQPEPFVNTLLSVALGMAGVGTLIVFREQLKWRPLALVGYFSFSIYLLHVFGTAPTRMLLSRAGIESEGLVFVLCLACGLTLPILFEITLGRVRWISWTFLGQRPYRRAPRY